MYTARQSYHASGIEQRTVNFEIISKGQGHPSLQMYGDMAAECRALAGPEIAVAVGRENRRNSIKRF